MKRVKVVLVITLAALFLVGMAARFSFNAGSDVVLPRYGEAPSFTLTDSEGHAFDSKSLRGSVAVVNFFFTSCPMVCPAVNGRVGTLNRMFKDDQRVRFVSISIDPGHDTPEVLTEYAARFKAAPPKWSFLTGDEGTIEALRSTGFKLDDGKSAEVHTTRLVLIDRAGTVRGYYQGTEDDSLKQLARDIQVLVNEKS